MLIRMYCACVNGVSLARKVDARASAASPEAMSTNAGSTIRVRVTISLIVTPEKRTAILA